MDCDIKCTRYIIKSTFHYSILILLGKNTIKGTIQMIGHSLKLHFCMFEKSQGKHNILDCQKKFGIFFIDYKFYMLKDLHKSKMFLHVHSTQTSKMNNLCFFSNILFLLLNVHHSFWKFERILTLMIRRAKGLELMKIIFISHLLTFDSKVFLMLKIMDFENVNLIKVVPIYMIKSMNAWYTWYKINM